MTEPTGDLLMSRFVAVFVDGVAQLYDIFYDGEWLGSRRTIAQCEEAINNRRGHNERRQQKDGDARGDRTTF